MTDYIPDIAEVNDDGEELAPGKQRAAYDFETTDWTQPLCWAGVWGPKGAREHLYTRKGPTESPRDLAKRVLELMHRIQEPENIGHWWAHNGGKFDGLALCEAAMYHGWTATFANSTDGRILQAHLKPPGATKRTRSVTIRDSMCIVPSSLKHKKVGCDGECKGCCVCDFKLQASVFGAADYANAARMDLLPPERLRAGCIKDAELVLDLLDLIEAIAAQWGGKLGLTFSQTALACLKAALTEQNLTIPEHGGRHVRRGDNQIYNRLAREAYYGGRVEVFHHCPQGLMTELDITSSYPASMCEPMPWEFLGKASTRKDAQAVFDGEDGLEGVVQARVFTPRSMVFPVLPVKLESDNGGMFFPTGTFTGWWPANELRYAQEMGVRVQVMGAIAYTRAQPFESFIRRIFELKRTSVGAARHFYKLLLNAAYGKFAQRPEREQLRMCENPGEAFHLMDRLDRVPSARPRPVGESPRAGGRCIAWDKEEWPKHTHFAIASYITGYSRIAVHQGLVHAGQDAAYCDTDAVHFRQRARPRFRELVGDSLGKWKVELDGFEADYFAPKIYLLWEPTCPHGRKHGHNCAEHSKGFLHFAAKGFPVGPVEFRALITGGTARRETMRLIRSQLAGDGTFQRTEETKSWQGLSRKRRPLPDGGTIPWTYEQLVEGLHEKALSPHVYQVEAHPHLAEALELEVRQVGPVRRGEFGTETV